MKIGKGKERGDRGSGIEKKRERESEVILQPFSRLVSILDAATEPRPTTAYITVLAPFSPSLLLFCRPFMPFVQRLESFQWDLSTEQ